MKATVVKLNFNYPTGEARTANDIVVAFRPPLDGSVSISDQLEINLELLDTEQDVVNLTKGRTVRLMIESQNLYDLRLPGGHGIRRFPSLERRRGSYKLIMVRSS